jgi:hypothetical protein
MYTQNLAEKRLRMLLLGRRRRKWDANSKMDLIEAR